MEPADERREHRFVLKPVTLFIGAAMEPADERREHSSTANGPSGAAPRRNGARRRAAGARDVRGERVGGVGAAMEPADERREH